MMNALTAFIHSAGSDQCAPWRLARADREAPCRPCRAAPRWRVTRLVGAAVLQVCELEAASVEAAVKRAIRRFLAMR